jgi:hypothetical protein
MKSMWCLFFIFQERGKEIPHYAKPDSFDTEFGLFLRHYKPWLLSIDVKTPEPYWKMFTDHRDAKKEEKQKAAEKKKSVFLRENGEDVA